MWLVIYDAHGKWMSKWLVKRLVIYSGWSFGSSYMNEHVAHHIHIYEPLDEPLAHIWIWRATYEQVARQVARICGCDEPLAHSYMTSHLTSHLLICGYDGPLAHMWIRRATCSFIFNPHVDITSHIWASGSSIHIWARELVCIYVCIHKFNFLSCVLS